MNFNNNIIGNLKVLYISYIIKVNTHLKLFLLFPVNSKQIVL
jgi:hypothetical protein